MRRALLVTLTTAVPILASAAPAPAASTPEVRLSGGTPQRTEACGAVRAARVAAPGERLTARLVRAGRTRPATLALDACRNGRWVPVSRIGRGTRVTFAAPADGDFRLRAVGRRGVRAAHVRTGVGEIVDVPFEVPVVNRNRTASPCAPGAPDGTTYPLRGHLTAPRSALRAGSPSAALYYHGLSYGEFFWRFRGAPGLDASTELARRGHVSVTVDRLGYGASTGPAGAAVCYGSQADIAEQVVRALKAGTYRLDGERPVTFGRVALVGHSAGAFIGEIAAYSFTGIDALAMLAYADQGASPAAVTAVGVASARCLAGGEPQDADGPGGYAYFGETEADFRAAHLNAPTDPAVADAVTAMRTRDPCGDLLAIGPALAVDQVGAQLVRGPVLVLAGALDALFPPPAADLQAARMAAGGADVTLRTLADTGHAMTVGRTAPLVREALSDWLRANGF